MSLPLRSPVSSSSRRWGRASNGCLSPPSPGRIRALFRVGACALQETSITTHRTLSQRGTVETSLRVGEFPGQQLSPWPLCERDASVCVRAILPPLNWSNRIANRHRSWPALYNPASLGWRNPGASRPRRHEAASSACNPTASNWYSSQANSRQPWQAVRAP